MRVVRRIAVATFLTSLVFGLMDTSNTGQSALAAEASPEGFVSEFWRIFVQQTQVGVEASDMGLKESAEDEWIVSIVDLTNFGTAEATSSLADFALVPASERDPIAANSSDAPSVKLGLEDVGTDGTVTVPEDSTVRIALAFSVSREVASNLDPSLQFGEQSVDIASTTVDALSVDGLGKVESWGGVQGSIQSVVGNGQLEVSGARIETVSLAGALTPPTEECFGAESTEAILALTGGTVWVEEDPTSDGKLVWFFDADAGHLRLLNQSLIEQGFGAFNSDYEDSAYGGWLKGLETNAKESEAGLWAVCKNATGTYINPPTESPEQVRGEYVEIDVRDLVIRPDTFNGEKIVVSGEVFNIQVEGTTTFMQIWVGGNQDAVGIVFEGDSTGIYEGTWVTVYGTGRGTFTGTNAFGGPITQPLIEADIVDR